MKSQHLPQSPTTGSSYRLLLYFLHLQRLLQCLYLLSFYSFYSVNIFYTFSIFYIFMSLPDLPESSTGLPHLCIVENCQGNRSTPPYLTVPPFSYPFPASLIPSVTRSSPHPTKALPGIG